MKIFKIATLLILQSCSFNIIPNNDLLTFYDLDLIDQSNEHLDTLCISNSNQSKQILVSTIDTLRPYDGFKVYFQNRGQELIQLGDVQWVTPLSTLFPSKIEELVNIDCNSKDLHPTFTTNILSKTQVQLNLTLAVARITEENEQKIAEAKINASIQSEITGKFIQNKSKTIKIKLEADSTQETFIKTLQKALRTATIEILGEIKDDRY